MGPCLKKLCISDAQNEDEDSYFKENKAFSRGIQNLRNTCYLNSALQCLHKSKHFKQSYPLHLQANRKVKSRKEHLRLSEQFNRFLSDMDQGKSFNPQKIKKLVAEKNYLFGKYIQNDAIQFFLTFLTIISLELNSSSGQNPTKFDQIDHYNADIATIYKWTKNKDQSFCNSIVQQTFTGRYQVTYTCSKKHNYVLFQKFNIHQLQIPTQGQLREIRNHKNVSFQNCKLEECLKLFNNPDNLRDNNQLTCDKCNKQTDCLKVMNIYEANKILIFGIKRFYEGRKNETIVEIPPVLFPKDILLNYEDKMYKGKFYRLYAAILHYGSLTVGHYTSVCLNPSTKKWINFSDSRVSQPMALNQVDFSNAYAVFYELVNQAN